MRFRSAVLWLVCAMIVFGGCAVNRVEVTALQHNETAGFLVNSMTVRDRERLYALYVPPEYTPEESWPLVVFLHGIGERGDDGLFQTEVGIGRAIRRHADRFPCLVLMPQCPEGRLWGGAVEDIETAMAQTRAGYNVDPARIYLTGLSMGGYGTWRYGAEHVDLFAALVPICGGGRPQDADELAKVPIWAFHGAEDRSVDPRKSREMVDAVREAGGDVRYTEYPGVGHNSWDAAYDDPNTVEWLLDQRKGAQESP